IKLLQLSNIELNDYVDAELERNPLLEREDADGPSEPDAKAEAVSAEAPLDTAITGEDFSATTDLDAGHDDLYADASPAEKQAEGGADSGAPMTDWTRTGAGGRDATDEDLEGSLVAQATLKDHLETQLSIACLEPDERLIAVVMIEAVDEAG